MGQFRVACCHCVDKTCPRARTIHMERFPWKFSFSCKSNSFSYERLCTRTRFETEAQGNLKMPYSACPQYSCSFTVPVWNVAFNPGKIRSSFFHMAQGKDKTSLTQIDWSVVESLKESALQTGKQNGKSEVFMRDVFLWIAQWRRHLIFKQFHKGTHCKSETLVLK